MDRGIGLLFVCIASIAVHCIYCVMKDAYVGYGEGYMRATITLSVIGLVNLIIGIVNLVLEHGTPGEKITAPYINLFIGAMLLIVCAVMVYRKAKRKNEE